MKVSQLGLQAMDDAGIEKHGDFEIKKQRWCGQTRAIRINGWLSDLELENIHRMIDTERQIANQSTQYVEENQVEEDMITTIEENEQVGNESDKKKQCAC